ARRNSPRTSTPVISGRPAKLPIPAYALRLACRIAKAPHSLHADLIYQYMLEQHGPQRQRGDWAPPLRCPDATRAFEQPPSVIGSLNAAESRNSASYAGIARGWGDHGHGRASNELRIRGSLDLRPRRAVWTRQRPAPAAAD